MWKKLAKEFENNLDVDIKLNTDLEKFSTIKLSQCGNLAKIYSIESLKQLINFCSNNLLTYIILGLGANQLLSKRDVLYIKLDLDFDKSYLAEIKEEYTLPASVTLGQLTAHAIKNNLSGWEVFTGIPATLGGAVAMNAGTRLGEIGELIKSFKILDKTGAIKEILVTSKTFSYRRCNKISNTDVIIEVVLIHKGIDLSISSQIKDYLFKRNESQPLSCSTCGCVFKNPTPELPAGLLIESSGLKGLSHNGIKISKKHANFFENTDNANISDFFDLEKISKNYVELNFGQKFELEVKI